MMNERRGYYPFPFFLSSRGWALIIRSCSFIRNSLLEIVIVVQYGVVVSSRNAMSIRARSK
jgi:hypothetical protein